MNELTDKTLEPDEQDIELLHYMRNTHNTPAPRVVVLYHANLAMIGAALDPTSLSDKNQVTIGRLAPEFLAPPGGVNAPLEDRYISREQLKLRWLPEETMFEVEPAGRRPVAHLELLPDQPAPRSNRLEGTTRLAPGSLITIGNRIMLGLDFTIHRANDAERLGMVGESERLWQLRVKLHQLAKFVKPALILGPTGAGKELVARAIHNLSERSEGPFVPLNCAALPEHLTESLLFGHKKGAFTGASNSRDGAFVEAEGGSLFLDEIGELPLAIQAKLLRVLQEKQLTPVGSNRPIPVDVRLIAATHRNLKGAMERNEIRADFYYRIAVHSLHLPSLSERAWDVPLLFTHFLRRNRANHAELDWLWEDSSTPAPPIPMSLFIDMMRYGWPGNIRELQNAVDQISLDNLTGAPFTPPMQFRESPGLETETVEPATRQPPIEVRANRSHLATLDGFHPAAAMPTTPAFSRDVRVQLASHLGIARRTIEPLLPHDLPPQQDNETFEAFAERVEVAIIDSLLDLFEEHAFNQVRIAEEMRLSRTTLIRLMKRLGVPRPSDISEEELNALREETGGDMDAMASALGIPTRALRLFITHAG